MRLHSLVLHHLRLPMREPFQTSYGVEREKDVLVVELRTTEGSVGWAECVASSAPHYTEETSTTAWHVICDFLVHLLRGARIESPADLTQLRYRFHQVRGHRMAKAALEMAVWDAYAATTAQPLVDLLRTARPGGPAGTRSGTRPEIPVGISIGVQPSILALLKRVEAYLEQGFHRCKLKIGQGWDVEPLTAVRDAFPDSDLMADANSAYQLADADHLRRLDPLHLTMIEQPLAYDDFLHHAQLQTCLHTALCLDESIRSAADASAAVTLGACRVINVKPGRVGGFAESLDIHDLCQSSAIGLWCGGMLETGIGRLHNVALTALPGFTLPGDTAPSARYFEEDLIDPPVTFSRPGWLRVEPLCGVDTRVQRDRVAKWTVRSRCIDLASNSGTARQEVQIF